MGSPRWAVFVSGSGTNLQSLLSLRASLHLACIVSSRPGAIACQRASRNFIPLLLPSFSQKESWALLSQELKQRKIQKILLLGFMRIVPEEFLKNWKNRIWNLHPSLLPAYIGAKALERSFEERAKMGVSLHDVIPEMDAGLVRLQSRVRSAEKSVDVSESQFWIHKEEQRLVRTWVGY
ncbi:MAG: formyltransferase family protein [Pseudobdellovibrionaceae bacterium]